MTVETAPAVGGEPRHLRAVPDPKSHPPRERRPPGTTPATADSMPASRRLRFLPTPQWDPVLAAVAGAEPEPVADRHAPRQQELPLGHLLPGGLPVEPSPVLTVLPAPRRPLCDDEDDGPARTARADLPDPQLWAARLAQAVVEVSAGGRPLGQLLRWTSHEVYCELAAQHRPRVAPRTRARSTAGSNVRVLRRRSDQVRSVHVCEPADGVAEVSAVVAGTTRWWALALRLEGLNGRWVLTRVVFV